MSITKAKRVLGVLWVGGFLFSAGTLAIQDARGVYQNASEAWDWLLPAVLPTVGLMISVFVADELKPPAQKTVSAFMFWLTFTLSLIYLLAIVAILWSGPALQGSLTTLQLMKKSTKWVSIIQGLNALLLGVFFVNQNKPDEQGR